ncbi:serine/threonine protein kinase [Mucilaginibacter sp. UYNi724]
MGKIFTITAGLENLGALRTGGQGSVYKGRRIGEIFVAVKILPTPIHAESEDDKNFKDFINEVEKLKKVNENPTPHVVKILNSGITESGSLPFIEMEFIEGPDLGELLKKPHDPIFTVPEIIKVANQLAAALAHCHKVSVKHGDIKSNNVKFNIHTGNYVLLDFGLAIMSDEQRRDSLKNAGAVEFMAPEQNEGNMLPQSDVYSYGIILYELVAGVVPFPLTDNGNSARNNVMIAHVEMPVPDLLEIRRRNLPQEWPEEKREREMHLPEWLLELIRKCLEKKPQDRYADGMELQQAILLQNSALAIKNDTERALVLENENESLLTTLYEEQNKVKMLHLEIVRLETTLASTGNIKSPVAMPKAAMFGIGLLLLGCGAFAGRLLFSSKPATTPIATVKSEGPVIATVTKKQRAPLKKSNPLKTKPVVKKVVEPSATATNSSDVGKKFTLFSTYAYFHDRPDEASIRKANINRWNNARLKAIDDQNGYIYVIYKNEQGEVSKGWLNKKNLIQIGE